MTETELKNLELARKARDEGNTEEAKKFYSMVTNDDPKNGEAKFFLKYYSLFDGGDRELPRRFSDLCDNLTPLVKNVIESDADESEKISIIGAILDAFIPETWTENRYMNNRNHETNTGNSFSVYAPSDIASVCKKGMATLKEVGDFIADVYESSPDGMDLAVSAWKEYVSLAQKMYAYAPKGDAQEYAARIQEVDPSYVMPKKAGCISFSENKN